MSTNQEGRGERGTVTHLVRIDFDRGWPTALMVCPYDATDPDRPCRPHDEDGEPSVPGDFCNWEAWFSEGGLDCVGSGSVDMPVARAEWDADGFIFHLAALAAPVPVTEGWTE